MNQGINVKEGKMNQTQIAQELGISKSYLSMILNGQRKASPTLARKLKGYLDELVHKKTVNSVARKTFYTQEVRGSSPLLPTINHLSDTALTDVSIILLATVTPSPRLRSQSTSINEFVY